MRRSLGLRLLPLLLLVGGTASQEVVTPVTVDCSVEITQPNRRGFRTLIACTSQDDTSGFFIVAQNATTLNNTVTYYLNGVKQLVGNNGAAAYVEDGSLLSPQHVSSPALVAFGFRHNVPNVSDVLPDMAGPQNATTLSVKARVEDVILPAIAVHRHQDVRSFSGLKFSGIKSLLIRDSVFRSIISSNSNRSSTNQSYAAVMYDASFLDAQTVPAINITNTTFSHFSGVSSSDASALSLQDLASTQYGPVFITNTTFTHNKAHSGIGGAGLSASMRCLKQPCTAQLVISDCQFASNNNTHGSGGAIYSTAHRMHISRCNFSDNSAARYGGAVLLTADGADSELNVSGTVFSANLAGVSGGGDAVAMVTNPETEGAWFATTVLTVGDSTLINNHISVLFGGDNITTTLSQAQAQNVSIGVFSNVTFINSYALIGTTTGTDGAVADVGSSGLTFDACEFNGATEQQQLDQLQQRQQEAAKPPHNWQDYQPPQQQGDQQTSPPDRQQPPPLHHQPPPDYQQQPPDYNQQPPDYNQQPPDYNQQPPGYNQQPPDYNQQPPADYLNNGQDYQQPPADNLDYRITKLADYQTKFNAGEDYLISNIP